MAISDEVKRGVLVLFQKVIHKLSGPLAKYSTILAQLLFSYRWDRGRIDQPRGPEQVYVELCIEAEANTYNNIEVDEFETSTTFAVSRDWLKQLANRTRVVIKDSPLDYCHGRILYSALRKYINDNEGGIKKFSIVETGTACGFSSICMAKALSDANKDGVIHTIDVLPHETKMFWNLISDTCEGKLTRQELLMPWSSLANCFVVPVQGYGAQTLNRISIPRVNFAFLDGAHTFDDVMAEFLYVQGRQQPGDMIIFDDYNPELFGPVVAAIDKIERLYEYRMEKIFNNTSQRGFVIARRI